MSNDSNKDGYSSGDRIVETTPATGGGAVMTGEQPAVAPGTILIDQGTLQHFQTALMNLISEANKIGLSLPIGLGVSSPYDLVNTSGSQPSGKSQPGVHVATLEAQARSPWGEVSQDHPENSERRQQKKGRETPSEENPETFELDPRDKSGREKEEPTELLVLDDTRPDRTVKIGAGLSEQVKRDIS